MVLIRDMDDDVVALPAARPQARHAPRRQPLLVDDAVQHRLRVVEQAGRAFADHLVVQDRGIIARQFPGAEEGRRSEEHTSELQSLTRISYAVFCLKKKLKTNANNTHHNSI